MAVRTVTISTPIPLGVSRDTVMDLARGVQLEMGLDPLADRPERALARRLGTVHEHGLGRLIGDKVQLLSTRTGEFEFWPDMPIAGWHVTNWMLGHLVGHAVLHRPKVDQVLGPDTVMVCPFDEPAGRTDDERRAGWEANWFMTALTLPRERIESDVARFGHAWARRHCGVMSTTFDNALRFYGIEHLTTEVA